MGVEGMDGDGVGVGREIGGLARMVTLGAGRLGGAAPHDEVSGRLTRSLPKEPLPPLIPKPEPRPDGT